MNTALITKLENVKNEVQEAIDEIKGGVVNPDYLIVTHSKFDTSDLELYRSKKYTVKKLTVDGKTHEQIKDMIEDYDVKFIVIIGSTKYVPSVPYGKYKSDYLYSEKPLGRIVCETQQQLGNYIRKVIEYERDSDYLSKTISLIAGSEAIPPTGWKTATRFEQYAVPIFQTWNVTKFYCHSQYKKNESLPKELIWKRGFNLGDKIVAFCGHGGGLGLSLSQKHGSLLYNEFEWGNVSYPILVCFACATVCLDRMNCTSTDWTTQKGGTIAHIGSVYTCGVPNTVMKSVLTELRDGDTIGEALVNAKAKFGAYSEYKELYHLIGDPALRLK